MSAKQEDKLDYYTKMFKKIQNKEHELFVISRIIHLLNDQQIEFSTQQYVRAGSKWYFLDLYFPQLGIAIEIDESFHKNQVKKDKVREPLNNPSLRANF